MSGLESSVAMHRLNISKDKRSIKQAQRRFHPEMVPLIEEEASKLIKVGFIKEVKKKQLKMNPSKCTFRILSGKFLDFVVRHRGIEIDLGKIKAIQEMPLPKTLKELKSLQGKPMLSERLAKQMLLLSEYEITYELARAIKGQAVGDFLAAHSISDIKMINDDVSDEQVMMTELRGLWQMYFDGASRTSRTSAGHVEVKHIPRSEDARADALTSLPAALACSNRSPLQVTIEERRFLLLTDDVEMAKWIEAIALRSVKERDVVNFIQHAIIYRYSILKNIVTDNGTPFKNKGMKRLCWKYDIQHSFLTPYYPPANGLAEAFNKTIVKILKKTVAGNKRDWDEKLQEALWAYRTTHRTTTKVTLYSLVYGVEANMPIGM
ncbi:uncharacterized protein LOC131254243 [Magnolia sinica]|uniref:uncharacterized protein LOC131254243 n=1 Tax=Magnolia sinica TaxID=86752 RepID=UPI002658EDD4|nr:uncharacterized protein LOC131254243 [Magnolia sinica]